MTCMALDLLDSMRPREGIHNLQPHATSAQDSLEGAARSQVRMRSRDLAVGAFHLVAFHVVGYLFLPEIDCMVPHIVAVRSIERTIWVATRGGPREAQGRA